MLNQTSGGGGTFAVVLEATVLASPQIRLQSIILSLQDPNSTTTQEMWSILANNGLKWADDGWGGFSTSDTVILINPKLDKDDAALSAAQLIDFGKRLQDSEIFGAQLLITEFPSWGAFFEAFTSQHVAVCW